MQTVQLLARTLAIPVALAAAFLLATGCTHNKPNDDATETVEASEIADEEGVAPESARPEDLGNITAELILEGDEDIFDQIDRDTNDKVDSEEFDEAAEQADIFGRFDVNSDRTVTEDELHSVMFEMWDNDDTGLITPSEYLVSALNWFPEDTAELENFADVDANDDGLLSKPEFVANMDDIALFDQWDLDDDADIARDELSRGLRKIWDVDKDSMLTVVEFTRPKPSPEPVIAGISTFEVVVAEPYEQIGTVVTGEGEVSEVISDRGFWIGDGDDRVFAVVREDVPSREMIDVDAGDQVELIGLMLDSGDANLVAGELEDETLEVIESEPVFLSVYHGQLNIVSDGG
jgi:hypothetical protein